MQQCFDGISPVTATPEIFLSYDDAKFSRIAEEIKVEKAAFADMFAVKRIDSQCAGQAGVFKFYGIVLYKLSEGKAGRDRGIKAAELLVAAPPVLVSGVFQPALPEPDLFARRQG
jgi:hypothetical protein